MSCNRLGRTGGAAAPLDPTAALPEGAAPSARGPPNTDARASCKPDDRKLRERLGRRDDWAWG
eukprot:11017432-Alexandrium_andersonii.AAC.1